MKRKRAEQAVSDIVATILLLGITVALFSVVSLVVLSYPFPESTPIVNIVGYVDGNNITLEHNGGEDLGLDTKISVIINGTDSYLFTVNDIFLDNNLKENGWNVGENVVIDSTEAPINSDIKTSRVEVTVVDVVSNSIVLTGILQEGVVATPVLLETNMNDIPYDQPSSPITLSAVGDSRLDSVTLMYRYSSDNISWIGDYNFNEDDLSPWEWNFNFPDGIGYYRFYSIGKYGGDVESTPSDADTECYYSETNDPPAFGTPSPSDGATDQPLSFTWQISITDPDADQFDWTIECNNSQISSGTGESDGTKQLSLSGLSPLTTYTVWVNATDPSGSGLWTRDSFIFITETITITVYDFSSGAGTTHHAYGTYSDKWRSDLNGHRTHSEFDTEVDDVASDAYADLAYSDATGGDSDPNRYQNPDEGDRDESTMTCEFYISEDRGSVTQLDVLWEGYGDANSHMELYIWNYAQANWGNLNGNTGENNFVDDGTANDADMILQGSTTSSIADYIDTDGEITLLIYMDHASEASFHDYVSVTITS